MNKKIVILIIFILILIAGGVFWWWEYYETPPEKWDTAKVSRLKDYVLQKQAEKIIVRNDKARLNFQLSNNWFPEQKTYPSDVDISFYSSDVITDKKNSYLLQKGCKITVGVTYIKTNIVTLEKILRERFTWDSLIFNDYEIINIDSQKAIRHTFEDRNLRMYFVGIHVPTKNKLCEIVLDAASQDKEQCEKEFDKFLETVKID